MNIRHKWILAFRSAGVVLSLLFQGCGALALPSRLALPPEAPINKQAGRGGLLVVTLSLEDGRKLPFVLDTGTSGTLVDESLELELGKPAGAETFQSWGKYSKKNYYRAPKLFLDGVQLRTGKTVAAFDFTGLSRDLDQSIKGMLGIDTLRNYCIQLDFANGKMRFLDDRRADKRNWGKAFPIVRLNAHDSRPAVADNLLGLRGPHSLIDSGCTFDGWLMPKYFQQWTNQDPPSAQAEARSPNGQFDGEKYPLVSLERKDVESDGIGLRFLARHLVTLDFPDKMMYLKLQSALPLPDPDTRSTPMPALNPLISDVLEEDISAARLDLSKIEHGNATGFEKKVAANLEATLENDPKPSPADVPLSVAQISLGDCRSESAEVGWLKPAANRIPLNSEIESPLLDSGKIYATGLFAHSPSRYVYNLDGKWKTLRGEAGLHTAFQGIAYGVVFVIKADGTTVFRSGAVSGADHPLYDVDVTGVKTLEMIVEQAQQQNGGDWGLWLDPILSR